MAGHKKKKKPGRVLGLILLLALALAAVGYFALIRKSGQTAVAYKAYTAQVGTISNASSFSGSLALIDDKTYAATSSATVRNVYVSEGDSVSEGDRLMRLSNGQTITADFDGRVNKLYAVKDDEVAAGDSLLQIADFDHMLVSVRVDEYDISDVSVGQACRVTTTATEKTFESEISSVNYISSNTNGNVAYYAAEARVDVNGQAYPGMQVTLTIPKEEAEDVIVLKMDAISFDQTNQAFV